MRIIKIEIENAVGLEVSMGIENLNIDIPDNDYLFNLIKGLSGSGKTTFMMLLTIFPYPSFNRNIKPNGKGLNIPNKIMRRKITYDNNLQVEHKYTDSGSSHYWRKLGKEGQWVEKNTSGTITMYRDILERELGLKEEFRFMYEMSTQTNTFIETPASDRKKVLSTMMPNVDMYYKINKKQKKKLTELRASKKEIAAQVKNLGDKKENLTTLEQLNLDMPKTERLIEEKLSEFAIIKNKVVSYDEIKNINVSELRKEQSVLTEKIDTIECANIPFPSKESIIVDIDREQKQLRTLNDDKLKFKESLITTTNIITTNNSKIKTLQNEIESNSNDSIHELMIEIDNKKQQQSRLMQDDMLSEDETRQLRNELENTLELYDENIPSADFEELDLSPQLELIDNESESINRIVNDIEHTLEDYNKITGIVDTSSAFSPVPECDNCPLFKRFGEYVSNSFDSGNLTETLVRNKERLDELGKRRESIVEKINKREYYGTVMKKELLKHNLSINELVEKHHIISADIRSKLDDVLGIIRYYEIGRDIDRLEKRVNVDDNIKSKEQNIQLLREQNNQYLLQQTKKNLEMEELNIRIEKQTLVISKLSSLLSVYAGKDRLNEIDELLVKVDRYGNDAEHLNKLNEELGLLKTRRDNFSRELNKINYRIRQYEELNIRLTKVEEGIKLTSKIERASSPITGIPSIEMNIFLGDDIKDNINEFISLFFQDSLYVATFEINQKDFDILVEGGEVSRRRDASMCSKSEQRMLAIALSFALQGRSFDRNVCSYDIILLDEMSSGLDVNKQAIFINSLENYLKNTGHCSQVFLTSHSTGDDGIRANYYLTRGYNSIGSAKINPNDILFDHSKLEVTNE